MFWAGFDKWLNASKFIARKNYKSGSIRRKHIKKDIR